jgi:hypothetical protein
MATATGDGRSPHRAAAPSSSSSSTRSSGGGDGGSGSGGSMRHFCAHLGGSAAAAIFNFPLWKAAAIGQSGFKEAPDFAGRMRLIFGPPYKGVTATIFGMTWARAAIFYGSDVGKDYMVQQGHSTALASTVPPMGLAVFVQVANQPIVRSTIMLQDPSSTQPNVLSQLVELTRTRGWKAAYHGSSASVLKTVPKYVCAILVKDWVAANLPPPSAREGTRQHKVEALNRAAVKSVAAGVAGAALTNPLDVIRNEMFKFEEGFGQTVQRLLRSEGWAFCLRGMQRNLVAVAVPIAMTIFLTDTLLELLAPPELKPARLLARRLSSLPSENVSAQPNPK